MVELMVKSTKLANIETTKGEESYKYEDPFSCYFFPIALQSIGREGKSSAHSPTLHHNQQI